jgi:hypothetical protein
LYRTHWISPALSEKKRERLTETANGAPELVVVLPSNREWKRHRCGGGDLLMMENPGRPVSAASASTILNTCRRATPS